MGNSFFPMLPFSNRLFCQLLLSMDVIVGYFPMVLVLMELSPNTSVWPNALNTTLYPVTEEKKSSPVRGLKKMSQDCETCNPLTSISSIIWWWSRNPMMFEPRWWDWKGSQGSVCMYIRACVALHQMTLAKLKKKCVKKVSFDSP